jgi:sugar/nucleoside kinase (ribokinase family)
MQELSVDKKYVGVSSQESCGLCICLNHEGLRSFLLYPGYNNKMADYLQENYQDILLYLTKARLLHITSVIDERTPLILAKIIREVKQNNPAIKISCDPGYSWLMNLTPSIASILKAADFLFVNKMEFELLGGGRSEINDTEKALRIFECHELPETLLILKEESEIRIYNRSKQNIAEQCYKIDLIRNEEISDATGAGDIFAAGFLTVELLKGRAIPAAVEFGMQLMRAKLIMPPEKLYSELARIFAMYKGWGA